MEENVNVLCQSIYVRRVCVCEKESEKEKERKREKMGKLVSARNG